MDQHLAQAMMVKQKLLPSEVPEVLVPVLANLGIVAISDPPELGKYPALGMLKVYLLPDEWSLVPDSCIPSHCYLFHQKFTRAKVEFNIDLAETSWEFFPRIRIFREVDGFIIKEGLTKLTRFRINSRFSDYSALYKAIEEMLATDFPQFEEVLPYWDSASSDFRNEISQSAENAGIEVAAVK